MFTKHATLALAAIGTQAIRLSTVAHVDAEAEAEYRYGKGPYMPWPWGPGLAQVDAEAEFYIDAETIRCFFNPEDC